MKVKNTLISILNIIEVIILVLLTETVLRYIHIYSLYMFLLRIFWYIVGIANIVYGVVNIKRKNFLIGTFDIIIGIISSFLILINHTEFCYNILDEGMIRIINYTLLCICGILSIGNLILNRKLKKDTKNKCSIIIFILILLLNIFVISFISIIHLSNIKNFNEYLVAIQKEDATNTYILDYKNESIFLDENGQEIARKPYKSVSTYHQYEIAGKKNKFY